MVYLRKLIKYVQKSQKSRLFVMTYFVIVVVGIAMSFLGVFIPFLTQCLTLFGNKVCAPIGMHLAALASVPGYVVTGFLTAFIPGMPDVLTLFTVALFSTLFYKYLGVFFDRKLYKKVTRENRIVVLVVGIFAILSLMLLYLLRLML